METRRSWTWRAFKIGCWLLAGLVAIYVLLFVRFATGKPAPRINYTTLFNKPAVDAPVEDCAWPLYRKALVGFDFAGAQVDDGDDPLIKQTPSDQRWAALVSWLQNHQEEFNLLRKGSARPLLGFVLGPDGDANDAQLFPNLGNNFQQPAEENPPTISILLPHLNALRQAATALEADARLARQQGDLPRNFADIAALKGIGEQLTGNFLVGDLVALALRAKALDQIHQTLADPNLALSDADLQALAKLITKPDRADGLISYRGERMFFADVIQRMYTDDGNGDGRLTLEGMRSLQQWSAPGPGARNGVLGPSMLAAPVMAASRREVMDLQSRLMDLAEANLLVPYRESRWNAFDDEIARISGSPKERMRLLPIAVLLPSLQRSHMAAERYLGQREGLLIGIALELHRRQHGGYPATLDELVPALLPAVPADRISGAPVKYRLVDGKPVVYSVGTDRNDDGGRPPVMPSGDIDNSRAAEWVARSTSNSDGDWVLYPQPHSPPAAPASAPATAPAGQEQ